MTELQQLYSLCNALLECEKAKKARADFDNEVNRRLACTAEAKSLQSTEKKMSNEMLIDYKRKEKIINIASLTVGLIVMVALTVINFILSKEQVLINKPNELEINVWGYLLSGAVYGGLIMALICFWLEDRPISYKMDIDDELPKLTIAWLIFSGAAWTSLIISGFFVAEGWDKLSAIFYPIFIPLCLPFELINCLFEWSWAPLNGVPYSFAFNVIWQGVLISVLILVLFKWIKVSIKSSAAKNQWELENSSKRYEEACDIYNSKKAEIESIVDKEIAVLEAKLYEPNGAKYIIEQTTVVPEEDKVLKTVNNIIWCFEKRYADNVKDAKQWLARMAHDKAIQISLIK